MKLDKKISIFTSPKIFLAKLLIRSCNYRKCCTFLSTRDEIPRRRESKVAFPLRPEDGLTDEGHPRGEK